MQMVSRTARTHSTLTGAVYRFTPGRPVNVADRHVDELLRYGYETYASAQAMDAIAREEAAATAAAEAAEATAKTAAEATARETLDAQRTAAAEAAEAAAAAAADPQPVDPLAAFTDPRAHEIAQACYDLLVKNTADDFNVSGMVKMTSLQELGVREPRVSEVIPIFERVKAIIAGRAA